MRSRSAQAGSSPAPEPRATAFGPKAEGPNGKRLKLVIIDSDPAMIQLGRDLFGKTCDIPPGIRNVRSLEEAIGLVDEHEADVILTGKRIDGDRPRAWYDLLGHIRSKGKVPGARVVLWSSGLVGGEQKEGARYRYDAVVHSTDLEDIREVVSFYQRVGALWDATRSHSE